MMIFTGCEVAVDSETNHSTVEPTIIDEKVTPTPPALKDEKEPANIVIKDEQEELYIKIATELDVLKNTLIQIDNKSNTLKNIQKLSMTEDMLKPEFWTSLISEDEEINVDRINSINRDNFNSLKDLTDIFALCDIIEKKELYNKIAVAMKKPSYPLYKTDGSMVLDSDYIKYFDNCNIAGIKDQNRITYGIVVKRTDLRTLPTAERVFKVKGDKEFDRYQETAVYLSEPVAILHTSIDEEWFFVATYNYCG